ncbi:Na+/H+ antiporter NhaC family protein, partial [Chromohalobacter sp. 296-RDG]|uniref:Na+/H+ antiporter NhaC family protein n=1 Tax=Chromohalobacter sp. 296-RDG TaxID=2994062 RepID=UPI002468A403
MGLGIPPAYAAGAIVTGTFFGDKLSPLSDTTVMASAVCGVNIITHIKHMLYTTMPAYLLAIALYIWLGSDITTHSSIVSNDARHIVQLLNDNFNLSLFTLAPPLAVFACILLRKPVLPSFFVGIVTGILVALFFQGSSLDKIGTALSSGYEADTGFSMVDNMLSRGGLQSMMSTVSVLIAAAI